MNTGQSVTVLVSQKHMGNLKKEILSVAQDSKIRDPMILAAIQGKKQ